MRKIVNAPARQRVHAIRECAAAWVPAAPKMLVANARIFVRAALESSLKGARLIRGLRLLPAAGRTENLPATINRRQS